MSSVPDSDSGSGSGSDIYVPVWSSALLLCAVSSLWIWRRRGHTLHTDPQHTLMPLLSSWTAGVFLACCLLDVVPSYRSRMTQTFHELGVRLQFPVPEFLLVVGFFLVLVTEQVILTFREQSDERACEKAALPLGPGVHSHRPCCSSYSLQHSKSGHWQDDGCGGHKDTGPLLTVRTFILLFSMCLCSVMEGLAVGLQEVGGSELELRPALLLCKGLSTLALAVKLTQNQLRRCAVAACLMIFWLASPLGAMLGAALHQRRAPQCQAVRSALEGLAAGAFAYMVFMDVLPHALTSSRQRISKVTLLLTGFTAVTVTLLMKV